MFFELQVTKTFRFQGQCQLLRQGLTPSEIAQKLRDKQFSAEQHAELDDGSYADIGIYDDHAQLIAFIKQLQRVENDGMITSFHYDPDELSEQSL